MSLALVFTALSSNVAGSPSSEERPVCGSTAHDQWIRTAGQAFPPSAGSGRLRTTPQDRPENETGGSTVRRGHQTHEGNQVTGMPWSCSLFSPHLNVSLCTFKRQYTLVFLLKLFSVLLSV